LCRCGRQAKEKRCQQCSGAKSQGSGRALHFGDLSCPSGIGRVAALRCPSAKSLSRAFEYSHQRCSVPSHRHARSMSYAAFLDEVQTPSRGALLARPKPGIP
jgi:hypothetical protein